MHSRVCHSCGGRGWQWTMRVGVVTRRNPNQTGTVRQPKRCPGCAGRGRTPSPEEIPTGRRLPAL